MNPAFKIHGMNSNSRGRGRCNLQKRKNLAFFRVMDSGERARARPETARGGKKGLLFVQKPRRNRASAGGFWSESGRLLLSPCSREWPAVAKARGLLRPVSDMDVSAVFNRLTS